MKTEQVCIDERTNDEEKICPFLSHGDYLEPCYERCGLYVPSVGKCALRILAEYFLYMADLRYRHELFKRN